MNTLATEAIGYEAREEDSQEPQDESGELVDDEPTSRVGESEPIRLYLRQIGRGPLLTRAQEADIGRRIEVGQRKIGDIFAAIPFAVRRLAKATGRTACRKAFDRHSIRSGLTRWRKSGSAFA